MPLFENKKVINFLLNYFKIVEGKLIPRADKVEELAGKCFNRIGQALIRW